MNGTYKSWKRIAWNGLCLCLLVFSANSYLLIRQRIWYLPGAITAFLTVNLFAGGDRILPNKRLRRCDHGVVLLWLFAICTLISLGLHIRMFLRPAGNNLLDLIISAVFCAVALGLVFWNDILCVYLSSGQLGVKYRVAGILCGLIPVANLIALWVILRIVGREVKTEREKECLNRQRKDQQMCKTRYPLLLVHGVFFRDRENFNYWGRIPEELEKNGGRVFYGEHQSAASVGNSAAELADRIRRITEQTGCGKVNIIAHSKGGLDCRYAIANLGVGPMVASLTTVNTPHRGCMFADYLLNKIPAEIKNKVAETYNAVMRRMGDENPDFLAAVEDLTASACRDFDALPMPEGIFCQSIGSVMERAQKGQFPLNFSYHLVKYFDGPNDGLVAESSFRWGQAYTLVTTRGKRGISHGDMIDLNRENLSDFDVREFYVQLTAQLKKRGL